MPVLDKIDLTKIGVIYYTYRCRILNRKIIDGKMISLRSSIAKKLLNYFFINPHESLYVNELSRQLNLEKRNLIKKLRELEKEGILKSETRGNSKFYSINQNYPLYNEYKKIITKTVGFEGTSKRNLENR